MEKFYIFASELFVKHLFYACFWYCSRYAFVLHVTQKPHEVFRINDTVFFKAMAKKNTATPEKVYSRILNIRLSEDEYRQLQENASKKGLQISTAVRLALFGEKEKIINTYADSDWKYKLLLAVQECRSSFKKISVRINNAVTVYDRSVDERDDEGRKLLSTTQTIRHITGLTNTLMEMQKSLNVVLEMMNAQPVHSAAWPSPETRVGKLMSEERSKMMPTPQAEEANVEEPKASIEEMKDADGIPLIYRYMFKATITGKLTEDASEFVTQKGNVMMKFNVKVVAFIGGKDYTHYIDVIRIKNGLFQYLKKGVTVCVVGNYNEVAETKSGEVIISKTIYADDVTLT